MSNKFDPEMAVKQLRARMGIPYTIDEMAEGIERLLAERDEARRDRDVLGAGLRSVLGDRGMCAIGEEVAALSRCTPPATGQDREVEQ